MTEFKLLVRASQIPAAPSLKLAVGSARIASSTPLLPSIEAGGGLAATAAPRWHLLNVESDGRAGAWDVCHELTAQGLGAGPAVQFAEPDLTQRWMFAPEPHQVMKAAPACDEPAPQNPDYPVGATAQWYRDNAHSQFADAIDMIGGPDVAPRVRVAHLDTGYDPTHRSRPRHLRADLERNWVDPDHPNSAVDRTAGLLTNRGHGTGTLSILAASAPMAEVVPLRVADRVVLFSNGAIAQALDYVHSLRNSPETAIHVVTMSMGGLASRAWADAVNALYDAGVVVVTAAGNNYGNLPTRNIVFPARFNRVIAACGAMADNSPYADLPIRLMAGNTGPDWKMRTAVAGRTPNVPWARLGCAATIDLDGAGTSAATPQVAAAAALYLHHHWDELMNYPEPWMRVEAVRRALFEMAAKVDERCGRGALRAAEALGLAPVAPATKEERDSASFPLLKVLTGMAVSGGQPDGRLAMLELEALQLSQSRGIELLLPDPLAPTTPVEARRIARALADEPGISSALRALLLDGETRPVPVGAPPPDPMAAMHLEHARHPPPPMPARRRLRAFACDPTLGTRLETHGVNETVLDLHWECLKPGPVGEYVEVIDVDPASGCAYAPVDLDHPHLLSAQGLAPSEANPQFHQQMVYAVAMKTIEHFEQALGRVALWSPRIVHHAGDRVGETFVRRLRIYPHAVRAANAYYSPDRKALLFGYFTEAENSPNGLPSGLVFSALSHDIIAHETTHALLDGLHRRFVESTNPDVLAFHEAFADLVALFQHFTVPAALEGEIARTRGDLTRQNMLGKLAVQFGRATRGYGALRDYIGTVEIAPDGTERWAARPPRRTDYRDAREAHDRGSVLVAAVFDAFLKIYAARTADLIRLATGGTGVLPEGAIPADLVARLADEAAKTAGHWLTICIRALDYCPPVDITFGDYLRAMITADRDAMPEDRRGYRVALVSAFRDRGIFGEDVRHLSAESLAWEPPPPAILTTLKQAIAKLEPHWDRRSEREEVWRAARRNAVSMHKCLGKLTNAELTMLGLARPGDSLAADGTGVTGTLGGIEVHSVRPARRTTPDGEHRGDWVIEILQSWTPATQPGLKHRGGCTLLVDAATQEIRYLIRKRVAQPQRVLGQRAFLAQPLSTSRREAYSEPVGGEAEPFAMLHGCH